MTEGKSESKRSCLVISRQIGESVIVNGNIEIRYRGFSCQDNETEISLAIIAPRDVPIFRKELIK